MPTIKGKVPVPAVGTVLAVIVVPAVVAANHLLNVLPEENPPAVYVKDPKVVVLTPSTKALEPVFTTPAVKFRVPEAVPVLAPFNNELALLNVTPLAFVLLMVMEAKLAVGEAVKFLKTPVPLTVWATVEGASVLGNV